MNVSSAVLRFAVYFQRNGFRSTLQRAGQVVERALFSRRVVFLGCEICGQEQLLSELPACLQVERKRSEAELSSSDLSAMTNYWNPRLALQIIRERFDCGASLWIIKSEGELAGYGWTLQGRSVEPCYIRLQPDDVHLFDFLVFPAYRGRNYNPLLVNFILQTLTTECRGHAYLEVAQWNYPQLASLRKTPFQRLGSVWMLKVFGYRLPLWARNEGTGQGFAADAPFGSSPARPSRLASAHNKMP